MTPVTMTTAEWICPVCATTNRTLVAPDAEEAEDRCVSCHARSVVTRGERPVRWEARRRS